MSDTDSGNKLTAEERQLYLQQRIALQKAFSFSSDNYDPEWWCKLCQKIVTLDKHFKLESHIKGLHLSTLTIDAMNKYLVQPVPIDVSIPLRLLDKGHKFRTENFEPLWYCKLCRDIICCEHKYQKDLHIMKKHGRTAVAEAILKYLQQPVPIDAAPPSEELV